MQHREDDDDAGSMLVYIYNDYCDFVVNILLHRTKTFLLLFFFFACMMQVTTTKELNKEKARFMSEYCVCVCV